MHGGLAMVNGAAAAQIEPSIDKFDYRRPHVWFWYRARHGKEQDAADRMREANIPVYWPNYPALIATSQRRNGRLCRREKLLALIPGSIFVMAEDGVMDFADIIDRTPGLTGIVRRPDGKPAMPTERDIGVIRQIEAGANTPPPAREHAFKPGQRIRFTGDIHSNFPPGHVRKLYKDGRLSVDVSLLGRIVPIETFPHQIEAM